MGSETADIKQVVIAGLGSGWWSWIRVYPGPQSENVILADTEFANVHGGFEAG